METIGKNLEALAAFHAVARDGSFTVAGQNLGLSKSMVSKLVMRLEAHLSTQLFHRTTRSLGLTEHGQMLLNYSQKIMDFSVDAEKKLMDLSHGDRGHMRISVPVGLGATFFTTFLPEISKLLPNVTFHADISSDFRDLVKDQVDFAIRTKNDNNTDAIARYIGHVRDVICASPSLVKKDRVPDDPKWLETQNCILYANNPAWNTWNLTSRRDDVQVRASGRQVTNTYQSALAFCLNGLGIARLPFYLAADDLKKGRLVQLYPDYQITTHPLYLVYLKNDYPPRKHKVVKSQILNWFSARSALFVDPRN